MKSPSKIRNLRSFKRVQVNFVRRRITFTFTEVRSGSVRAFVQKWLEVVKNEDHAHKRYELIFVPESIERLKHLEEDSVGLKK